MSNFFYVHRTATAKICQKLECTEMCKIGKLPSTEMISISFAESVFAFGSNGRDPAERTGITGSEKIILKK